MNTVIYKISPKFDDKNELFNEYARSINNDTYDIKQKSEPFRVRFSFKYQIKITLLKIP